MPVIYKLLMSLVLSVTLLTVAVGQTSSSTPATWINQEASDSLLARRSFFSTAILQQGNRLNSRSIRSLMADNPPAYTRYRQGQWLKPMGPLLILSGVFISYLAVKGTPKTAYARGIGTRSNPNPPDVLVEYTDRNLPALLGGIGLVVGGLCLIEIANGQTVKSIKLYNAQVVPHQSVTGVQKVEFGLTSTGNLGFKASL